MLVVRKKLEGKNKMIEFDSVEYQKNSIDCVPVIEKVLVDNTSLSFSDTKELTKIIINKLNQEGFVIKGETK
jgi:hypothetical protein